MILYIIDNIIYNCIVLYCIYAFGLVQHHVNDDEVHHKGLKVITVPFECIHATHCSVCIVPNASV